MKRYTWKALSALAFVVVCALVPGTGRGQGVTVAGGSTGFTTGAQRIGIENFRCDCTLSGGTAGQPRRFEFRSEPMILGIYPGSPADGLLQRGDYITHVDGYSVLTQEGARRLAGIDLGDDVNLTIRRDGATMKVAVHAPDTPSRAYVSAPRGGRGFTSVWTSPPTPSVAPGAPSMPGTPYVPSPAPPGVAVPARPSVPASGVWVTTPSIPAAPGIPGVAVTPSGWFGFSIRCSDCGWSSGASGENRVWEFDEAPELSMVSPNSPAGRAGLRAGDRLTHIDGISLLSKEGGRRFGQVVPGQKVKLTVKRGNSTLTKELRLSSRPETRAAIYAYTPRTPAPATPPAIRRELRYTGQLDNVSVEVWSAGGPTIEKVGDTLTITVGASVVRLKVDSKKNPD